MASTQMKHALITGYNGFVGSYLTEHLLQEGWAVTGLDRTGSVAGSQLDRSSPVAFAREENRFRSINGDLTDPDSYRHLLEAEAYTHVFHLAGMAFVPDSWKFPAHAIELNAAATADLISVLHGKGFAGRFLFVSSSDVYGAIEHLHRPLQETDPLLPDNPYAVSKEAAEKLTRMLCTSPMESVIARPFNHTGPHQNPEFVVPAFVRRIQNALQSGDHTIRTGDLSSARDFTDVRDVVRAYALLAHQGLNGETYNVCSGQATTIQQILDIALGLAKEFAGTTIHVKQDPDLLRPEGSSVRFGSPEKLMALGWKRTIELQTTVRDIWEKLHSSSAGVSHDQ